MNMLSTLRNALLAVFLGLLSVLVIQLCFLVDQVSFALSDLQGAVDLAAPPMMVTIYELRGAAQEQRRYYKATGKALTIATVNLARLIENTDYRTGKVLSNANVALVNADMRMGELAKGGIAVEEKAVDLLDATQKQVDANGYEATMALAAARGNFEQMEKLWPSLNRSARHIEESADNLSAATHHVEAALAPLEKPTGRLKWVLKWLLGLPHYNVR